MENNEQSAPEITQRVQELVNKAGTIEGAINLARESGDSALIDATHDLLVEAQNQKKIEPAP